MSNARDKANIPALNFSSTGIDDNATSTAITIDSSENVGIGTSSPNRLLTLGGTANARLALNASSYSDFTLNSDAYGFSVYDDNNTAYRLTINNTGNVGIGTTSPTFLNTTGSALAKTIGLYKSGTASSQRAELQLGNAATASGTLTSGVLFGCGASDTTKNTLGAIYGILDATSTTTASGALTFWTAASGSSYSEKMRINSSGNVGIGTSSPNEKLDSRGSAVFSGDHSTATNAYGTAHGILISSTPNLGKITAVSNGANDVKLELRGLDGGNANSNQLVLDGGTSNVGVGTSPHPNAKFHIRTSNDRNLYVRDGYRTVGGIALQTVNNAESANVPLEINADAETLTLSGTPITFTNSGTERMRIDSSGAVVINNTSAFDVAKFCIKYPSTNRGIAIECSNTTSASQQIIFKNPNGIIGNITTSGSSTAFNTSSDHRLKENVVDMTNATDRLKQLQPKRFNFIADADTTVDGFLAHEVSSVVPEAITGTHNETQTKQKVVVNANGNVIAENIEQADWEAGKIADEDGNTQYPTDSTWEATKVVPVYQGIDQSKLVPLLVKTIQELEARITTLEANNP
jgi:hypothetical protein